MIESSPLRRNTFGAAAGFEDFMRLWYLLGTPHPSLWRGRKASRIGPARIPPADYVVTAEIALPLPQLALSLPPAQQVGTLCDPLVNGATWGPGSRKRAKCWCAR